MRFYFNEDESTCREYFGWYECEVSDAIKEKFNA